MQDENIITMKDGRQYRRTQSGSLARISIVKMNKKQRRKLYAKMRAAVQDTVAVSEPEADDKWSESDERKKFLADIEKEW